MTPLQKIRTSFSTQLTLWVAGFVTVTLGVVIFLLARFSEDVIRDETIDTTQQALENTALRIDNTLRQAEITARLEKKQLQTNRSRIEQMIDENGLQASLRESLPHLQLYVTRSDSSQLAYNDQENYVFSQPVGNSPYSLTAVCPVDDIKSRYSRMHDVMIPWGIIGMV